MNGVDDCEGGGYAAGVDLQTLKNVGPKVESHLQLVGIESVEQFLQVGAVEAIKRMYLTGEVKPHIMLFHALKAAEQDRNIFSFDSSEKIELKLEYHEILAETIF